MIWFDSFKAQYFWEVSVGLSGTVQNPHCCWLTGTQWSFCSSRWWSLLTLGYFRYQHCLWHSGPNNTYWSPASLGWSLLAVNNSLPSLYVCLVWSPSNSVLGSLLLSVNMLLQGKIILNHNIKFHCYKHNTHQYLPVQPNNQTGPTTLAKCLDYIKGWVANNFLQLNENKGEIVLFCPQNSSSIAVQSLNLFSNHIRPYATNLEVPNCNQTQSS